MWCVCLALLASVAYGSTGFMAGSSKVDATLIGAPLAGYNHGDRRVPYWPLPVFTKYTTWMTPSVGALTPIWVKCLYLETADDQLVWVTMDGIGANGALMELAWRKAYDGGLPVEQEKVVMSASHSHSGPGAVAAQMLWSVAPAEDLFVPEVQDFYATKMANAMLEAYHARTAAKLGSGTGTIYGVTKNRRAKESPFLQPDTIDPYVGVLHVTTMSGAPIGTLWNFAIHGTCYGPSNMEFSGDIMGLSCTLIEERLGGVAFFVNADAGDIDPQPWACEDKPLFRGSPVMADEVVRVAQSLQMTTDVAMKVRSLIVPFGRTDLNATLGRFSNCTSGGELDICSICEVLRCDLNVHMPPGWIAQNPRFTAAEWVLDGTRRTAMSTQPGESLNLLGNWTREVVKSMNYDNFLLSCYSNTHMGYFSTPREYLVGGYESQLTFWGIDTAEKVLNGSIAALSLLRS